MGNRAKLLKRHRSCSSNLIILLRSLFSFSVETDIYGREVFQDGSKLRLEQDLLRPLAQARKLFVYETKDFWRQIKTAG